MKSRMNVWISRLAIVSCGLTGGASALAAEPPEAGIAATAPAIEPTQASTPLTAEQAAAKAQEYRESAAWYRSLGGAGYKSAFLRWAEAESFHFAAVAARLSAVPTVASPEAERARALVESYRNLGGAAYKAGLVQRAEEKAREYEPVVATLPVPETALGRHLRYGKAIEEFLTRGR